MKYRKIYSGSSSSRVPSKTVYEKVRELAKNNVKRHFDSPEAELLLGMVLGVNDMYRLPRERKMFVDTGTIHVVVVSGFNISLVYTMLARVFRAPYKMKFVLLANIFVFFYVCIVGFAPPVTRAWLMGILGSFSRYCGKRVPVLWLLILSGLLMLVYNPYYLFSLSFQLSFLATTGLIVFSKPLELILIRVSAKKSTPIQEDFICTVSAQALVWPLLSYRFGTVSISSFFVNGLVLWTVPLITVLGFVYIGISFVSLSLASLLRVFLLVLLKFFVYVIRCFSELSFGSVRCQVGLAFLAGYYFLIFIVLVYCVKISDQKA